MNEKDKLMGEIGKKKASDDFTTAASMKTEYHRMQRTSILILKSRLGNSLVVRCPACGSKQHTQTTISKKCTDCSSSFRIYPKNKMSRIEHCPKNLIPILHQLYCLENEGKFLNVL